MARWGLRPHKKCQEAKAQNKLELVGHRRLKTSKSMCVLPRMRAPRHVYLSTFETRRVRRCWPAAGESWCAVYKR